MRSPRPSSTSSSRSMPSRDACRRRSSSPRRCVRRISRERGEALETLEQGCTRAGLPPHRRPGPSCLSASDPSRAVSVEDWVRRGLDSPIPLERAAAVTALPEVFPGPRAAGLLKPVLLRERTSGRQRGCALSVSHGSHPEDPFALDPRNDIEVVDLLRRAPLLSDFQTAELAFLVEKSERRFVPDGRRSSPQGTFQMRSSPCSRARWSSKGKAPLFEGRRGEWRGLRRGRSVPRQDASTRHAPRGPRCSESAWQSSPSAPNVSHGRA